MHEQPGTMQHTVASRAALCHVARRRHLQTREARYRRHPCACCARRAGDRRCARRNGAAGCKSATSGGRSRRGRRRAQRIRGWLERIAVGRLERAAVRRAFNTIGVDYDGRRVERMHQRLHVWARFRLRQKSIRSDRYLRNEGECIRGANVLAGRSLKRRNGPSESVPLRQRLQPRLSMLQGIGNPRHLHEVKHTGQRDTCVKRSSRRTRSFRRAARLISRTLPQPLSISNRGRPQGDSCKQRLLAEHAMRSMARRPQGDSNPC
jgi:hypothetical protein